MQCRSIEGGRERPLCSEWLGDIFKRLMVRVHVWKFAGILCVLTLYLAYFLTFYLALQILTFSLTNILTVYLAFFLADGFIDVWGSFDASLGTCELQLLGGVLGALAALAVVSFSHMAVCKYVGDGLVSRGWAFQFAMPRMPPGYGVPGASGFFGAPHPGYWNLPSSGSAPSSVRSLAEVSTADTGADDGDDSSLFDYTSGTPPSVERFGGQGAVAVFMAVWAKTQAMKTIQIHRSLAIIGFIGGWLLCVPLGTQDIITFSWGCLSWELAMCTTTQRTYWTMVSTRVGSIDYFFATLG